MEEKMEKLLEKQMWWQKVTAILLAVLLAALAGAGMYLGKTVQEMTVAVGQAEVFLQEASDKLDALDVEGINGAFARVDAFVYSLDGVVKKTDGMVDTIDQVTKDMGDAAVKFEEVSDALSNFTNKFSIFR